MDNEILAKLLVKASASDKQAKMKPRTTPFEFNLNSTRARINAGYLPTSFENKPKD